MRKVIPIVDKRPLVNPLLSASYKHKEGSPLKDHFGRPLRDLRISVTDRCNFRCDYCMPRENFGSDHTFLPYADILSFEEIARLARIFAKLGVDKLRLTGGEPLLRKNLSMLLKMLSSVKGNNENALDIAITTNATLLKQQASALKQAGLNRITVSLDALEPQLFKKMSDSRIDVATVLEGIRAADQVGLAPLKINMVVRKNINDNQIIPLAEYFRHSGKILRFIEFMDVGVTNSWMKSEVLSATEIISIVQERFPLEPISPNYDGEVARRWRYLDGAGEVGVISSVSQTFCGDCTRMRLSPEGRLYTCLFAENGFDLRTPLRDGADDQEITDIIAGIWHQRNDRYSELRGQQTTDRKKIEMSYIGG